MENEGMKVSDILAGITIGAVAMLAYEKYVQSKKRATMNSRLADLSVTLMKSIKDAADKGMSASDLYNQLLKQEADKKAATPVSGSTTIPANV